MKILYGVQGTGNGHLSRARMMAKYFKLHNAEVTYLFSGRRQSNLFDMEVFGNYLHREGLTFITESGAINYLKTALNARLLNFAKDVATLNLNQYDVVISDFEPVTAWAANLQRKPLITTGHQYAFGENTPVAGETLLSNWVMKLFAPSNISIGQHWHPYHLGILPPIIDTSLSPKPCHNAYVVYLPFENQQHITEILQQLKPYQFIQYSSELKDTNLGNVALRKANHHGFKNDLCGARGVICNTGFELNSECLHLGIPVLTRPLSGQMEQLSNAKALQQLGYAEVMNTVNVDSITQWLQKEHKQLPRKMPDVANHLVNWILGGEWHRHAELSHSLWQEYSETNNVSISPPNNYQENLTHFLPDINLPKFAKRLYSSMPVNITPS